MQNCTYSKSNVVSNFTGYVNLPANNEQALLVAVATIGPISVTINALSSDFQFYSSGIFNSPSCGTTQSHAVAVVAYGNSTSIGKGEYWVVKVGHKIKQNLNYT